MIWFIQMIIYWHLFLPVIFFAYDKLFYLIFVDFLKIFFWYFMYILSNYLSFRHNTMSRFDKDTISSLPSSPGSHYSRDCTFVQKVRVGQLGIYIRSHTYQSNLSLWNIDKFSLLLKKTFYVHWIIRKIEKTFL